MEQMGARVVGGGCGTQYLSVYLFELGRVLTLVYELEKTTVLVV